MHKNKTVIGLGIAVIFYLLGPFVLSDYMLYLVNLAAIATIGAVGLNILTGYTGLIAMANGAFIGVGAYTAAVLYTKLGVPFLLTIPIAGLMTAVIGMIFGIPALRLRGFYLAMSTLAAQILLMFIFNNWTSVTNGERGIFLAPPNLFGFSLVGDKGFFFLTVGIATLGMLFSYNLFKTDTGRAFIAIRDRDIAANIIGVDIFKYKLISFAISSFYAGVAGALFGFYMTYVSPEGFGLNVSIDYIAMIIVGGLGNLWGGLLGAIFVVILPEFVDKGIEIVGQFIPMEYTFAAFRQLVFGLMIIVFLVWEPKGLAEIFRRLFCWLKAKIFSPKSEMEPQV
ncbi:MAG: branched-chain amino acid ABC transporter permease [Deltaproteobacteria bacterium]|nr:branched-chain amino acid ABC transporter permease [Deltaproteobacteria bacterium]